jgi:hypothetical protein
VSNTLASLGSITDMALLQLPGCSYALALEALRGASRDFCRRTGAWTEEIALTTVAGTLEYPLSAPDGTVLEALWRLQSEEGTDVADVAGTLDIVPPSTVVFSTDPGVCTLTFTYSCIPSGSEIPAWMIASWQDVLVAGAVARRKRDTAKPWSDPQGSGRYQSVFDFGVRDLYIRSRGGFAGREQTALQGVRVL